MRKLWLKFSCIFLVVLMIYPEQISANSAPPPTMTMVVENIDEDIDLELFLPDRDKVSINKNREEGKNIYEIYIPRDIQQEELAGAKFLFSRNQDSVAELPFPKEVKNAYAGTWRLDFETGEMRRDSPLDGQWPYVVVSLITTLIVEGFFFFIFGYREKKSWKVFLLVNLISQAVLHTLLFSSIFFYWIFDLSRFEVLIFLGEATVMSLLIKEKKRPVTLIYSLIANIFSFYMGFLVMMLLPI